MKQNLRALWALVKENRALYLGAVLCTALTVGIGFFNAVGVFGNH